MRSENGEIQTKRLILRQWCDKDKEPFAQLNADPRVMEYFPYLLSRKAIVLGSGESTYGRSTSISVQGWMTPYYHGGYFGRRRRFKLRMDAQGIAFDMPVDHFEICPVCNWEDDDVQFNNPDFRGGANKESLNEARENYKKFGAASKKYIKEVRSPLPDEIP